MKRQSVVLVLMLAAVGYGVGDSAANARTIGTRPDTSSHPTLPAYLDYPGSETDAVMSRRDGWWILTTPDSLPVVYGYYQHVMDSLESARDSLHPDGYYVTNIGRSEPSNIVVFSISTMDERQGTFGFLVGRDSGTDIAIARWQLR